MPSMRLTSRFARRAAVFLVLAGAVAIAVRAWLVPALIVGRIGASYGGHITIRSWWLGRSSAGVTGLVLHEGKAAASPVWATVERAGTDLSWPGILRGRTAPSRIELQGPRLEFRLDRNGRLLTAIPARPERRRAALPAVVVRGGTCKVRREGRAEAMTVSGIGARLRPDGEALAVDAAADDPTWGRWTAAGRVDAGSKTGLIELKGPGFRADPAKAALLPFVPLDIWDHVRPAGLVDVAVSVRLGPKVDAATTVDFRGTRIGLPSLGFTAEGAVGRMTFHEGVVRLDDARGDAIAGTVRADGTLDFGRQPARVDLGLKLRRIDVERAPKTWKLGELGLAGRLDGDVRLRAALGGGEVDLSGTTGEASIRNGSLQGIPVKSLRLRLRAAGEELRYETAALRPARLAGLVALLDALQAPPKAEPKGLGALFRLPRTVSTDIELEDVDLSQILARSKVFGIPIRLPIAGRLTLKASATIPLGTLKDLRAYAFHGDATLTGASIARVDLGRIESRLDLEDGVLELSHVRGHLVDRPDGNHRRPPPATPPVPAEGPLPAGGFRGHFRAELSPKGKLDASFDGNALPIGELLAPLLPRPTPVSGLLSLEARAEAAVERIGDPRAWSAAGRVKSERVAYKGSVLDAATSSFRIVQGRLAMPDLTASLGKRPLRADLDLDLAAPHAYRASLDVRGWDIADALTLIPSAPKPAPVDGSLTARLAAAGTLAPWAIRSDGSGVVDRFQVGPAPLGRVPFRWQTEGEVIHLTIPESHPFGGSLAADARFPTKAGPPAEGQATLRGLDTAALAAALFGGKLAMSGKANGHVGFRIRTQDAHGLSAVEANVTLNAPEFTVQGVPATRLQAVLLVRNGAVSYDALTEGLGGKFKVKGSYPLVAHGGRAEGTGELQAVGFSLGGLWKPLGVTGALARLDGLAAIDANYAGALRSFDPRVRGIFEVRDLRWGKDLTLGSLKGELTRSPEGWRIDPLAGNLLGGPARGRASGRTGGAGRSTVDFGLDLDRVELPTALAFLPALGKHVQGEGRVRLSGRLDEGLRADAEANVERATLFRLPVAQLRAPAELSYETSGRSGTLTVRELTARIAGGRLRADGSVRFGESRRFQADAQLTQVDLQTAIRALTDLRGEVSGRVTGRINVAGPDLADLAGMRGSVVADLDYASLFEIPVFREIDRFLGAARGGLFEDGDLTATIGHRRLNVEQFTLEGRLAQVHATGTVGFNSQLDLEVLVNTNQIIPETGQALARLIPGLNQLVGRREQALARVGTFLSARLLKLRVTGTLRNPQVNGDPGVNVSGRAAEFFSGVLRLPLGP